MNGGRWWGNSRAADGALTQAKLNKTLALIMAYGGPSKMMDFKDIEWDLAVDDAVAAVLV